MRLRLSIQHPTDGEREYMTQEPTVEIGRDPKATLSLTDGQGTISWRHARIDLTGGAARIEDLGSTNGTYVNGQRLTKGQPAPLRVRDVIQFGHKGPRLHVSDLDVGGAAAPSTMMAPMPLAEPHPPTPFFDRRNGLPTPTADDLAPPPSLAGPSTRLMLHQTQQRFRLFTIIVVVCGVVGSGVLVLAVGIALIALLHNGAAATTTTTAPEPATTKAADVVKEQRLSNEAIFEKAVKSTAYIRIPFRKDNKAMLSTGSGVLIDRDQRLVATAYHVIHGYKDIPLTFPKYANGNLLTTEEEYAPGGDAKDFLKGEVLYSDPGLDLAIVQLPFVPADVPAMPMAKDSPPRASSTHAIGGKPEGNESLWIPSDGSVRAVEYRTDTCRLDVPPFVQKIQAWMVITQNPINHGNSGGPLVNDRCELIGICSHADFKINEVTCFIDIRHVKDVLRDKPQKVLPGGK